MNISHLIITVLAAAFFTSYGWGMRGLLIGGEKGAMLPGALLGIVLAKAAGSDVIFQNYWYFAAAGLMGMTFGGIEPYGDSISMIFDQGVHYNPVKGYKGLMLKGAMWFGIAGGFIAMSFSALTGEVYKCSDIIIAFACMPAVQLLGYKIFNTPFDKKNGRFAKIYFCYESREEWGSNLGVLVIIFALALIRKDYFTVMMAASGVVSGAIGWFIAMHNYKWVAYPLKSGRYLLGKKSGRDGWKAMEFTLGACGGLGISLCFCLNIGTINTYAGIIEKNGIWNPAARIQPYMPLICGLIMAALLIINAVPSALSKKGKKINWFICDLFERPFFNVIPLCLVLLGSQFAARIMTFFMIVYAAALKCSFDRFDKLKHLKLWQALLIGVSALAFAGDILIGGYSAASVILLGGLPYYVLDRAFVFSPAYIKKRFPDEKYGFNTVKKLIGLTDLWFILSIAVMAVAAITIF